MTTLTVSTTTDFSATALNNIDLIDFTNLILTNATATFLSSQFNGASILNNVHFDGSAGTNNLVVNGGSLNASAWIFDSTIENITLNGSALADIITGSSGIDHINGLAGDDVINGGPGGDFLDGGLGINTLSYATSNAGVIVDLSTNTASGAQAQGDTISNFRNIIGSNSNDVLTGDTFDNQLTGGISADALVGGGGNDTFIYNNANEIVSSETLDGGTGIDTILINAAGNVDFTGVSMTSVDRLQFSNAQASVALDASNIGVGRIGTFIGGTAVDSVNINGSAIDISILLSNSFVTWTALQDFFNLSGTVGADNITGGFEDDHITGGAAADTLNGGAGNNTFFINAASDLVVGDSMVAGALGSTTNRITLAGAGNFDFTGATITGVDAIDFSAAASTVTLNAANIGGNITTITQVNGSVAANDLVVNGATSLFQVAFNGWTNGTDTITMNGTAGADSMTAANLFNTTMNGGEGDDLLSGVFGNDTINGGNGANIMNGGGGGDTINGGNDVDTANGGTGDDIIDGAGGNDHLNGGDDNDTLIGRNGDDFLSGDNGIDVLNGGLGMDSLHGGEGDDVFQYFAGSDLLAGEVIDGSSGVADTDTIRLTGGGSFDFSVATITQIERLEFGAAAATVTFGGGQLGAGSAPINTVVGTNVSNSIIINGDASGVNLSNTNFTGWNSLVDSITINGTAAQDSLTGSNQIDTINAGGGADNITLSLGADSINGGAGNDQFFIQGSLVLDSDTVINGGADTDTISAQLGTVAVNIDLASGQFVSVENATGSTLADTIVGNSDANIIDSGNGDDIVTGAGGVDQLFGGVGNDTFNYVQSGDVSAGEIISGGADTDTVAILGTGSFDFTGAAMSGIDRLTFGNISATVIMTSSQIDTGVPDRIATVVGSAAQNNLVVNGQTSNLASVNFSGWNSAVDTITMNGTALQDSLLGSAQNDTMNGGVGNDALDGAGGADTLIGGLGNDSLAGGLGNDRFIFNASELAAGQADTINDYTRDVNGVGDTIALVGISSANVSVARSGADAVISYGNGIITDTVTALSAGNNVVAVNGYSSIANAQTNNHASGFTFVSDAMNQAANTWSTITDNYDAAGNLANRTTVNDDNTRVVASYDNAGQTWSTIVDAFNAGNVLTSKTTNLDDGSYQVQYFDTAANPWSSIVDQFDIAGLLYAETTNFDTGARDALYIDRTNQTWSTIIDQFNAAGNLYAETTNFDAGDRQVLYLDQTNQAWTTILDQFNTSGNLFAETTIFDAGGRQVKYLDQTNQIWATIDDIFDNQNRLTSELTTLDNGNHTQSIFDVNNAFAWKQDVLVYDPTFHVTQHYQVLDDNSIIFL